MADPFLKFFTSDWRSDPRLRMCSAAARGVWIDMICIMHEAAPYGHLLVHGQFPNEAQLASLTGTLAAELPDLIAELERHGVFSRTREGVIYSRKLVRMAAKSAKARKNGKRGGNPALRNHTENKQENEDRLTLKDKGLDKAHIPDSTFQTYDDGGDAGARAVQISTPEMERPSVSPTAKPPPDHDPSEMRDRLLAAMGCDSSGLTGRGGQMIGNMADMKTFGRWMSDLGLSFADVLACISDTMQRKSDPGPPNNFTYFNEPMRRWAGRMDEPPLTPIVPTRGDTINGHAAGPHHSGRGFAGGAPSRQVAASAGFATGLQGAIHRLQRRSGGDGDGD